MYGALPLISTKDGSSYPALPIVISNPPKQAALRLPTTEEFLRYLSSIRSLSRDLGRRMSESEDVPNPEAERRLFDAIRLDKSGAEFDEDEISYALGILTRHKIVKSERVGNEFVIILETIFGKHTHILREPFHKELRTYQRGCYKGRQLPHGVEEQRFPPEVPVSLYDSLVLSVSGYSAEANVPIVKDAPAETLTFSMENAIRVVPPHHKRAVVLEVVSILASLDPVLDPNS